MVEFGALGHAFSMFTILTVFSVLTYMLRNMFGWILVGIAVLAMSLTMMERIQIEDFYVLTALFGLIYAGVGVIEYGS